MSSRQLTVALRQVGRLAAVPHAEQVTDRKLLEQFAQTHDEDAFAGVVARHGALVMGVCRRALGNTHDAEDVFQATFLVLARRASAVPWRENISGWLFAVACRLAAKANAASRQRHRRETHGEAMDKIAADPRRAANEFSWVLDEELARLPEKIRAPLVLCYLEGKTRGEAAIVLGYSERTLKRRLSAGKEALRRRLERRGMTLPAAIFAAALTERTARATVSGSLLRTTVRSAAAFLATTRGTELAPRAVALASRLLQEMARRKLSVAVLVTTALGLVSAGAGVWDSHSLLRQDSHSMPESPILLATSDSSKKVESGPAVHKDPFGDPLPEGAFARLGTVRFRCDGDPTSMAYSPNGRVLAAACPERYAHDPDRNSFVYFWDAATGKQLRRLHVAGPPGMASSQIYAIAFSPDGKLLASRDSDKVRFWDVATGTQFRALNLDPAGWSGSIPNSISFSPDGRTLAVPQRPPHQLGRITLFEVASGKELRNLPSACQDVRTAAFSPDGLTLAVVAGQPRLSIWNLRSGKQILAVPAEKEGSGSWAWVFSPDGKTIACGQYGFVILCESVSGREIARLKATMGNAEFLSFTPDGNSLIGVGGTNVECWEMPSLRKRWEVDTGVHAGPAAALSPDGRTVAAGVGQAIRSWDVSSGQALHPEANGHLGGITTVAFSPDGRTLATGGFDKSRLWDVANSSVRRELYSADALAFSPNGRHLAGFRYNRMLVWDTAHAFREVSMENDALFDCLAYAPEGRTLVMCHSYNNRDFFFRRDSASNPTICIWDATVPILRGVGSRSLALPNAPRQSIRSMAVCPNSATAAIGMSQGSIRLWDLDHGHELGALDGHSGPVNCLTASPDGKTLVSGSDDRTIRIWDIASRKCRLIIRREEGPIKALATSPSGRFVAASGSSTWQGSRHGDPRAIRIWDLVTGKDVMRRGGHDSNVLSLAFSPDGKLLASGLGNSTTLLWNVGTDAGAAAAPASPTAQPAP